MWWNSDDYLKPSDSILQSFFSLKMQLTRSESEHGLKGNWIFLSRLWYWDNISPPISWLMTAGRLKSNGSGSGFREMTRLRIWGSSLITLKVCCKCKMRSLIFGPNITEKVWHYIQYTYFHSLSSCQRQKCFCHWCISLHLVDVADLSLVMAALFELLIG